MKLSMYYQTTEKFVLTAHRENPYEENTKAWHIFMDLCTSQNTNKPIEVDVDVMLSEHGTEWSYYVDDIGVLVEDGYLDIIYETIERTKEEV